MGSFIYLFILGGGGLWLEFPGIRGSQAHMGIQGCGQVVWALGSSHQVGQRCCGLANGAAKHSLLPAHTPGNIALGLGFI